MRMHIRRMPIYIIIMVPPLAAYFILCSSFPDPHITWIHRYYKIGSLVCQGVQPKDLLFSQSFVRKFPYVVGSLRRYGTDLGIAIPCAYISTVWVKMKHPRTKNPGDKINRGRERRSYGSSFDHFSAACRMPGRQCAACCGLRHKSGRLAFSDHPAWFR